MRIAFTGASGTGKTSVANQLVSKKPQALPSLTVIGVDSRALLDTLSLRRAENINDDQYRVFQTMYFSQKILVEAGETSFLTERSFADGFAYWKLHCERSASQSENTMIHRICREQSLKYDHHFLFPTGFIPVEDDGYRHRDPEYHERFQALLQAILMEWDVQYTIMPHADVCSRADFILDNLK